MAVNPVVTNCDVQQLAVGNNQYQDISVVSAGAATLVVGTVLAYNTTDAQYEVAVSTVAKTNNLRCFLAEELIFAGAGTKTNVRTITAGDISEEKVIFQNGTDTLDTVGTSLEPLRLEAQNYGFNLIKSQDLSL